MVFAVGDVVWCRASTRRGRGPPGELGGAGLAGGQAGDDVDGHGPPCPEPAGRERPCTTNRAVRRALERARSLLLSEALARDRADLRQLGRARLWPAACGHGDCSCRTSWAASAYRLARAGSGRLDSAAGTRFRSSASMIARARSRRATAAGKSPFWTVA